MGRFRDLEEFFDPTLRLPVGGRTYVIPPPSAQVGLLCQRLLNAGFAAVAGGQVDEAALNQMAGVVLNDEEEADLYRRILGPVYDELIADGRSWPVIQHVGTTALVWVGAGEEAAARYWEASSPEAAAPDRQTATPAARSTRSRGSANGTTRSATAKAKARRSPGPTS